MRLALAYATSVRWIASLGHFSRCPSAENTYELWFLQLSSKWHFAGREQQLAPRGGANLLRSHSSIVTGNPRSAGDGPPE